MNSTSRIIISIIIIILIAAVVGWIWLAANEEDKESTTTPTPTPTQLQQDSSPSATQSAEENQAGDGIVKEIEVTNEDLTFTPKTLTVNRGDVVRVIFTSVGDTHTFTLPEFNVDTGDVAAGEQETVEFVAAEPGSFEFYCTPHRDMGMTGTLVVQ